MSQTNALSQTTTLTYDEAGRIKTRVEPEGTTTWTYNAYNASIGARGKLYTVAAPGSYSELYSYYITATAYRGQPAYVRRTIDGTDYFFNMSYDSLARLDVLTYPTSTSGYRFKADYDYDAYGQLSAVKDGNETYTYYTLGATDSLGRERSVSLGNGRTETRDYDEAAGYLKSIATSSGVQDLEFTYDEVGNVLTRFDDLIDETETFSYDALNRLSTSQVTGESTISIYYSAAGRITSKSDVGSYTYGAGAAGPFAVTSANGLSYTYDANGRMITRGSNDIMWYSFDKPKKIENGSKTTEFWYGADRARYKQELRTSGGLDATIRYVGTLFEFEDPAAGSDVYRHYVHAGSRVVAIVERVGTTNTKHFLHRDHQGSVTKVTNAAGSVIQSLAYDAWGLRRDAADWSALGSPFAGSHETERGYTGHEHLDTVGLIHMNGRVQDPILGRFISADPIVQAPFNTQSHNRYSYVWNNPASLVDPSGFKKCKPGDEDPKCEEQLIEEWRQASGPGWGGYSPLDLFMPDASDAQDREELARAFADASGVPSGSSNVIPSPPTVNPNDSFGDRLFDTSRQFIYVVRHQWKDVLRDSSQGVSEVPGAHFFGEVSGVDAAIEAILATGEGDYSDAVLAASGIFLGKLRAAKAVVFANRTAKELKDIYRWGEGLEGVQRARQALDASTMARIQGGLSKAEVEAARDMYRAAAAARRGGEVAVQRAEYMEDILRLWE